MTLDEAIKHAEEVAEKNEENANWYQGMEYSLYYKKCIKCASEHRQLAEWLRELKQLREQTRWIDANELLKMTKSYKAELGRLKADPFVKSGIETVERFIKEMPTFIEADNAESEDEDADSD